MPKQLITIINTVLAILMLLSPVISINFGPLAVYLSSVFVLIALFFEARYLFDKIKSLEKMKSVLDEGLERSDEDRIKTKDEKNKESAVINSLADGVLVLDRNNKVFFINIQAKKLLGVEDENLSKKSFSELAKSSNSVASFITENLKQKSETKIKLKNGLILDLSTSPLKFRDNDTGTLIVFSDITKQKLIEKTKNELFTLVAHQLKAPLSSTKMALKMLLNGDFGELQKQQKSVLEKTYDKNESLIFLVNDLLNLSKIEEGEFLSAKSPTDINSAVLTVIKFYKDEIKKKKIKFIFEKTKEKLPKINVDSEKIKMVIQNLVDNAIKYTPENGAITARLSSDAEKIVFQIKDSGIGVPENQKTKMFNEFFRGTNAIRTGAEGSGFGLFISKKIIEAHNGKLWFKSEEGKGSTFCFSLPLRS